MDKGNEHGEENGEESGSEDSVEGENVQGCDGDGEVERVEGREEEGSEEEGSEEEGSEEEGSGVEGSEEDAGENGEEGGNVSVELQMIVESVSEEDDAVPIFDDNDFAKRTLTE